MKRRIGLVAALSIFVLGVYAQGDCANGRYVDYNFASNFSLTSDVPFGQNIGVSGNVQDLFLDVYEPAGDLNTDRPVIIVAFGGSFVAGSKEDVAFACEVFAKLGYVAIAPDYRVGFFFPSSYTTSSAVMRGAHDLKACVRYLYKSVIDDGNPWGIDTTRIMIGGVSAGAISAMHAIYLDEQSEIPPILHSDTAAFGNVSGNSGKAFTAAHRSPTSRSAISTIQSRVATAAAVYCWPPTPMDRTLTAGAPSPNTSA